MSTLHFKPKTLNMFHVPEPQTPHRKPKPTRKEGLVFDPKIVCEPAVDNVRAESPAADNVCAEPKCSMCKKDDAAVDALLVHHGSQLISCENMYISKQTDQ